MEQNNNPQIIFTWKAPLRAYKKRGKNVLRFFVAVAVLLSLITVFFADHILLIPIWAVLFLFYTLTITPPPQIENKITTFGIESAGVHIRWDALSYFYFTKRFNFHILTVVSHAPYFLHVYMVVPEEETKTQLIEILSKHLMYQEKPNRTLTDKLIDWLSRLIPDDEEERHHEQNHQVETSVPKIQEEKKEEQPFFRPPEPNPSPFGQTQIPESLLRQVSDSNG